VGCWMAAEALLVASVWKWLRGDGADSPHSPGLPLSLDVGGAGELRLGLSLPLGGARGGERNDDESHANIGSDGRRR
jgi:hypothetical protein